MTREERLEKALRLVYGHLQAEHAEALRGKSLTPMHTCEVCAALKEAQDAWESGAGARETEGGRP
jgi:hypothetical protein